MTLVLTRADMAALLDPQAVAAALREACAALGRRQARALGARRGAIGRFSITG